MQTYEQGTDAYFTAEIYDHPGGAHADPSQLSLRFVDVDETTVAGPFARPAVDRLGVGLFAYTWSIPTDLAPGIYTATWAVTISAVHREAYEAFAVSPVISGTWANLAEISEVTGQQVTPSVLHQAQAVIDVFTGRTVASRRSLGTRDLGWLKLAVAYQAAWLPAQPDFAQRMDLTSTGAAPVTQTGMVLAPMARWALKRCSWLRGRSIQAQVPRARVVVGDGLLESADDVQGPWKPLGVR